MRVRILIALALLGALAGCQESGFDESKETQRPLKVQDAMNPLNGTKVPGQAERPATLSLDTLGDTLALRLKPVAAVIGSPRVPPYLKRATRGIEISRSSDLVALEQASPDVILGTKELDVEQYPDLMKIAPTILSEGSDWKLNVRLHGEGLGRTNDAERLLIDWDNRLAKVKRAIRGQDLSVLLIRPNDVPVRPGPVGRSVLDDLGIRNGTHGKRVLRIEAGPEWFRGGVLAARAALSDVARAL